MTLWNERSQLESELKASEERVSVDRRVIVDRGWLGRSVVRLRIPAAGLVLLAAGCMVLGWGSHSRQIAAGPQATSPASSSFSSSFSSATENQPIFASPLAAAPNRSLPAKVRAQSNPSSLFARLPLIFEPNRGQANLDPADARARFVARGSGYTLILGSEGAILSLASPDSAKKAAGQPSASAVRVESLQMKLAGANPAAALTATGPLPGKSNYLLGNDPTKWRRDIPQFAVVRYDNIYPGINLVFYGHQGRMEYDFQVAPGSDPARAELEFDGARQLELNDGALVIKAESGDLRLEAPRVYQQIAGREQTVEGRFVLRGANRAGFAIGPYDHSRELVIDPVLTFSTYFGGTGDEHSTSVALDGSGNIYLAGSTTSPTLPPGVTLPVFQSGLAGAQNVYIAKIDPNLNPPVLEYVTYLGGNGTDTPVGIGVDGAGDAFVAGTTSSTNFPFTQTAYQTVPEPLSAGTQHVFVTELNPAAASLLYSSYLSGNGDDIASGMTIDSKGYVYVTGTTTSSDVSSTTDQFPASNLPQAVAYQPNPRAPIQFFVTKVNTKSSRTGSISYSTYFGGGNFTTTNPIAVGGGIAVDTNGNMYFSGTTNFTYTGCVGCSTTDFPILNAYQPCLDQPPPATITNPPLCANASGTDNSDAFLAKLNPNAPNGAAQLLWSSYFGGSETDSSTGIALDTGAANVYITGTTNSPAITGLTSFAAYQPCLDNLVDPTTKACTATAPAANDAYVARLTNPTSTTTTQVNMALSYFSYLGGSGDEAGLAITVDSASGALVTGWTKSVDFPVFPNPGDIQGTLNGPQDAFVARLNTVAVVGQTTTASWATYFGGSGTEQGTGIALDVNQNTYFSGESNSPDLHVTGLQTTNAGGYDAFVTELNTAASLSITGVLTLGTNQTYISAGTQATFTYTVTNNGPDLASNITVTNNLSSTITSVPLTFVSASATAGSCSGSSTTAIVSCSIPSLQAGSTATITIVVTPTATSTGNSATFNGGTVQVTGPNNIVLAETSVSAQMSDFTLAVVPPNASVQFAGATATYTVQLTPHPLYSPNITLSCTGTPTGAACSFAPASVALQSTSPGAATLHITTTARPIVTPASLWTQRHSYYAFWLFVPGLALLGAGVGGDRRRRRILGFFMLCALFSLLLLQPACSSSSTQPPNTGTQAGTYTITVTGTSGSDIKSQAIQLTVP